MKSIAKKSLILASAFASLVVIMAVPAEYRGGELVDLSSVLNKTVCPIHVDLDVDLARIPQRIKMLRCGPDPLQWCSLKKVPEHECCHRRRDGVIMSCVEVEDTVEVYYPDPGVTQPMRVSVGCSCVMELSTRLQELPPE